MGLVIWSMAVVVLLTLLWRVSSVANYFLKWIIFLVVSLISASAPIPLMLLKPRDPTNALIPAAGLRACCKFLGIKLSVEGKENIVQNSGCVVVMNHQSMLDLIVLACLWPVMDNCTVISKKEIFYLQPFGLASWLWGTIFIDRVKSRDAQSAVNRTGEIINKRKARVLMFPEGTRNLGKKKLLPFKKGAFHLALASEVPVQPVAVCRYKFLKNFSFENGEINIKILPAISTKGLKPEDIQTLIDETYTVLTDGVDAISNDPSKRYSNGRKID